MKIALCLIATNKYKQFVQPLISDIEKYFFVNDEVTVHLFTDEISHVLHAQQILIKRHEIPPYKFPYATLYRYKIFSDYSDHLLTSDYIFYMDVDMRIQDFVNSEILPKSVSGYPGNGLIATRHPGFFINNLGSWCEDPKSLAYTHPSLRKKYYAGGFQGGYRSDYLDVIFQLKMRIDNELEYAKEIGYAMNSGIIAEWHDESFWNFYLSLCNPDYIKELTPEYCMVEDIERRKAWGIDHLQPKIIALNKNHKEIRS